MRLLVATRNAHKVREITAILSVPNLQLVSMDEYPGVPEVVEDGETFNANAIKKAVEVARATGMWTMADDSGLEVHAIGNDPGVRSARYAGEPANYPANNAKLLKALEGIADRRARFRCVIALSDPAGNARTVEGMCMGVISGESRGDGGFGYDPLFIPVGFDRTFAEMKDVEKNRLSHRSAALRNAAREWGSILSGGRDS